METAGEGGAWGIALLVAYLHDKKEGETLVDYLKKRVFSDKNMKNFLPNQSDVIGYKHFKERYVEGLPIQRIKVDYLKN